MAWRGERKLICARCNRERREGELFSRRGRCVDCGDNRCVDNYRQLRAHSGPHFDHWRRRCLAALGVFEPLEPREPE